MSEITLAGFGDIDEALEEDLTALAKEHGVKFYPTYYDWEMKGDADEIEKITMEMWSMPRDEWSENLLEEVKP